MYKGKSNLAIISARGGSKGLPRKNIRPVAGKPLIAYTIEQALLSQCFDTVIVSTEDTEIANISIQYGAEVPFLRPAELATDDAKGIDVVMHAVKWMEEYGKHFDIITLLQPTSPLRNACDIKNALDIYFKKEAGAVVSVCECEHSPLWMNIIGDDLSMKNFLFKEATHQNRQSFNKYYRLNGAIYIADQFFLNKNHGFFGDETFAYIMPQERSVDIDSELDLKFVEFLLSK